MDLDASEPASRRRFSEVVGRPDPAIDLVEAALLIACEEYPELDVSAYTARIDALGHEARERALCLPPERRLQVVDELLFQEQGFRGNEDDYYDPRNSYLNEVLDRRTGIPITLSTLYIEVARRAGLQAEGVGLPGHFIVRVTLPAGELLSDPFHGGARLTATDCQKRLDRIFDGKVRMEASMLAACGRRQMLERMLYNLKGIYLKGSDHVRALAVVDLLTRLQPDNLEELRDRGLLYASLDCFALAARDLSSYLALVPEAPEAQEIAARVQDLRAKAARVN